LFFKYFFSKHSWSKKKKKQTICYYSSKTQKAVYLEKLKKKEGDETQPSSKHMS